jgi:hypothetical protein
MAVTISFHADGYQINDSMGSGLAFFADTGFGASIKVGEYPGRTFISNGAGTTQGPEVDNVKFANSASGIIGQSGSGVALTAVPNDKATLNVRATSDGGAVQVQNAKVYIYDRVNKANPPSGVTCKAAEIIHPDPVQNNNGSGDSAWINAAGTGLPLDLAPSPGISGLYAGNGSNSTRADTRHDWFVALSPSPDSIGSKTQFGLLAELEYL